MGRKGLLVAIDFQKAFDFLNHRYVYKALTFFGFRTNFIAWIRIFLTGFSVNIMHAGKLLDAFMLMKGSKQGDPISSGIFVLCIEVLLIKIRSNNVIKKYIINGVEVALVGYADDLNLLIQYDGQSL